MVKQLDDLEIQRVIRKTAAETGSTPQQVRQNIEEMLAESRDCTDPKARAAWAEIPCNGDVPTLEGVFRYLAERIDKQLNNK